jgi:hypothetical protein
MGGDWAEVRVMFQLPFEDADSRLAQDLYTASLPKVECDVCQRTIARRKDRVTLRASWRGKWEYICPSCWRVICEWASRFALQQLSLPLLD